MIKVPVSRIVSHSPTFSGGVLLGIGIGVLICATFWSLGGIGSDGLSAAVAVSTESTDGQLTQNSQRDVGSSTPVPEPEVPLPIEGSVVAPARISEIDARGDTALRIKDKEIIIERYRNKERLLRAENASIVARFETNCGAWNADCGVLISEELAKNSARWEELLRSIQGEESALSALRR